MKQGERGVNKMVQGIVLSDKMHKTITVQNEWQVRHPKYGKLLRRHTVLKAHDEKNEAKAGDRVEIAETRPLSKTKRWRLVRVVTKAAATYVPEQGSVVLKEAPAEPK